MSSKTKFSRYTTAFLTIALASILLYPSALAGMASGVWILLGLVIAAALLTLSTK
jgi:hypothetical protein